ncbi:hypothetical protein NLN82_22710 [Citrobacter portucalensis]|uniref:Mor transcription activator family protein n=1 Tax=Citrobacter portucalensis TaxID=1639133 RepID=UPI00226B0C83|nr:Mor transcription activator family protein [Citrobacter portucalensis]MCX9038839.1 hypothetical protein [Citrobacter portucalensis]
MELEQVKSLLPETVLDIAELIGFPATIELVRVFGGTTLPLGKGIRSLGAYAAKRLRETIGEEKTVILTKACDGEILYLPRCNSALRELRNRAFIREFHARYAEGISTPQLMIDLCPKYGFSDRFAWKILKAEKVSAATQQHPLF